MRREGTDVDVPARQRGGDQPAGEREQPVAGRALGDWGGHQRARLARMVAHEGEVVRQRVVVDQLPAVREHRDVAVGQRRSHTDRGSR